MHITDLTAGLARQEEAKEYLGVIQGVRELLSHNPEAFKDPWIKGWIGRRWDDPAFPAAFPWFNTPRYWQDRILELREQIALMDEAPL